ncbi:hypothetical protein AC578_3224 [Pseudocercospora eumusae]|uniref:Extracellular membrane protein CFEM domain-containing protein n=1 Tax=Pseudocercospora eumusae TaxID=321146 RepID=A0A139H207_9PEZI|nr:hypothetical protein AC578_3224 [Pseudocercospora eumusae]
MKLLTTLLATTMMASSTLALANPPPSKNLCPNEHTMLPCRNSCKSDGQAGGFCIPTTKGDLFSPKTCKCYGGSGIEQRSETDQAAALDEILTILDGFPILSIDEIDEAGLVGRSSDGLWKRKCHMVRVCVGVWKAKVCYSVEVC